MTTSPYDTLPTGKQALAPTSGESIEEKPNPITNPYGGYEEISLEEAARLATPVISQSQDSGSSPAANRNSGIQVLQSRLNRNSGDPGLQSRLRRSRHPRQTLL